MHSLIVIYCHYADHYYWLDNFVEFFKNQGFVVLCLTDEPPISLMNIIIKKSHHVFMWNGEEDCYLPIKTICKKHKVGFSILEVGYFPQAGNFIVDRKGINAHSELMDDDLTWVGCEHLNNLDNLRNKYLCGKRYLGDKTYVLVPLQIESDTNIQLHSPCKSMQEFILKTEKCFPDRQIIFKIHPKDQKINYKVDPKNRLVKNGNILDYASHASLVYGINSTSLLESALLGAPVKAVGYGFIQKHGNNLQQLLAALVDKQINVESKDFTDWLNKYSNFCWEVIPCNYIFLVFFSLLSIWLEIKINWKRHLLLRSGFQPNWWNFHQKDYKKRSKF